MKSQLKTASIIFCIMLITNFAKGREVTFSGSWKLIQRTSLTGKDYFNGIPKSITVNETGNKLTISRATNIATPDDVGNTASETLTHDGKPSTNQTAVKKTRISVIDPGPDKLNFTEKTTIADPAEQNKILFSISKSRTLSVDGKSLTITRSFASATDPNDKWSMKGVYQKQ